MLGFIAVAHGQDIPAGPTIDPPTYMNPSRPLAIAQGMAEESMADWVTYTPSAAVALMVIVVVPEDEWAGACPDCLRAVGLAHDCTGVDGVVSEFDAVLMHTERVRQS